MCQLVPLVQEYRSVPTSASDRHTSWTEPGAQPRRDSSTTPTLYDVLGVHYTASPANITRAYREAMKRSHPDHQATNRRTAAEEHAKQLNAAYATLSKPVRRRAYDRTIQHEIVQDQLMSRYVGGFDPTLSRPGAGERDLWATPSAADRREQARSDRHALISLLVVFGGITGAVLGGLLLWSVLSALFTAII